MIEVNDIGLGIVVAKESLLFNLLFFSFLSIGQSLYFLHFTHLFIIWSSRDSLNTRVLNDWQNVVKVVKPLQYGLQVFFIQFPPLLVVGRDISRT